MKNDVSGNELVPGNELLRHYPPLSFLGMVLVFAALTLVVSVPLAKAQTNTKQAEARALVEEIGELSQQKQSLDRELISLASRIQTTEIKLTENDRLLTFLNSEIEKTQSLLKAQTEKLTNLLAALQRLGYHLPPSLITHPDQALRSIRSAEIVGLLLEEYQQLTQNQKKTYGELETSRAALKSAKEKTSKEQANLAKAKAEIELLLAEKRNQINTKSAIYQRLKAEVEALDAEGAGLADLSSALPNSPLETLTNRSRPSVVLALAAPFSQQIAKLNLPTDGVVLRRFGDKIGSGNPSRGMVIATRKDALVTSPYDARVIYSHTFRRYGHIVFLSFDEGYSMLIAGLEKSYVVSGQFVLAGEPLGIMGARAAAIAAQLDISSAQPILYLELKKEKAAVDPSPWWRKP